mgnify:FL=1|tara:strand:+ start:391 stop:612 length:222 start_codon:yes stop_codon:yes gene_type:complete
MEHQFSGKTAIISGAAGGIGFALAQEFGQLGMNVVLADIDQKQLDDSLLHSLRCLVMLSTLNFLPYLIILCNV